MIVARICQGKKTIVETGSVQIAGYTGKADGWFPIESFSFGLQKKADAAHVPGAAPAGGKTAAKPSPPTAGAPKGGDGEHPELQIEKSVDTASCSLMKLVMQERSSKKGVGQNATELTADIHTISSIAIKASGKIEPDRFLYTSLMIHLEAVDIKSWSIHASGDSRATESVVLRYDRSAMIYVSTRDGQVFQTVGPTTWDQSKNKDFPWPDSEWKDYLPNK